jgi:hypothetical protein
LAGRGNKVIGAPLFPVGTAFIRNSDDNDGGFLDPVKCGQGTARFIEAISLLHHSDPDHFPGYGFWNWEEAPQHVWDVLNSTDVFTVADPQDDDLDIQRKKAEASARTAAKPKAAAGAVYRLLDMGEQKYGDCIVAELGGRKILIDCGHPGDDQDANGHAAIPEQLDNIYGAAHSHHFDLLIVTHCHSDHIGCLPKLLADGLITCDWALVSDERLGFGLDASGQGDAAVAQADPKIQVVIAAMSEEDQSDLNGDALAQFISDAATLQSN